MVDSAFAQFERWGIRGMMVDFLNRDDQEMVNIQTAILQKAAAHHLHIQFHGAYKPTGLSRTYPKSSLPGRGRSTMKMTNGGAHHAG